MRTTEAVMVLRVAAVPLFALAVGCGDGSDPLPPDPETVAAVALDTDSLTLLVGEQAHLVATVTGSKGNTLATPPTWSSLDKAIATVSGTGQVSAVSAGDARIVASAEGRADTARVRVRDSSDLPEELSGTYRLLRFAIEEDQTYTATGPTVIQTDGTLRVDGTLRYAPGAEVLLYSGDSLVVNGAIEALEASAPSSPGRAPFAVTDPCGNEVPADLYLGGLEVKVSESSIIRAAGDIYVVASRETGYIGGRTALSAGHGAPGCRGQPGGPGHSVHIGSSIATSRTTATFGLAAYPFASVELFGPLLSGSGGDGWSVDQGRSVKEGPTRYAQATDGGPGGDITVTSTGPLTLRQVVLVSAGGNGGSVQVEAQTAGGDNGAGENLDARGGSGGAGGTGTLTGATVQIAGAFSGHASPGDVTVGGGHGGNGRAGGRFDIEVGRFGEIGTLHVNGVPSTVEAFERTAHRLRVENAIRGGVGPSNEEDGGPGGELRVKYLDPTPTAELYSVFVGEFVGLGGGGFDGCVAGGVNGTNGGRGGTLEVHIAVRGDSISPNAFSGGVGGDGNGPGLGGLQGKYVNLDQPMGHQGADGRRCPGNVLDVTPETVELPVDFGGTCPTTERNAFRIRHTGEIDDPLSIRASARYDDSSWSGSVSPQPAETTLGPGQEIGVDLRINCPTPDSDVSGAIEIEATWNGSTVTKAVGFVIRPQELAVELAHTLSAEYPAGAVIPLRRIEDGFPLVGHMNCSVAHLHSETLAGIFIDGKGPFPDPDDFACGYGPIISVPVAPPTPPSPAAAGTRSPPAARPRRRSSPRSRRPAPPTTPAP